MTAFVFNLIMLLAAPFGMNDAPVSVKNDVLIDGDTAVTVNFDLSIQRGWHVYSVELPEGGPVSASITIDTISGLAPAGGLLASGREIDVADPVFNMQVRYFENSVRFSQSYSVTSDDWFVSGYLTYAACNDESCIPPQTVSFKYGNSRVESVALSQEAVSSIDAVPGFDAGLWAPAKYDRDSQTGKNRGLLGLFLVSMLGGLLALLTPCVWPVIPMTVSFFLKRAGDRKSAVRDALIYGISIVTVYVLTGLIITSIFGANALNSLATNAVVNIIFFVVLVAFALSFFGLFEITLPSSWSTGISKKSSQTSGVVSIFLMALTLSIVSFSCTGPIIGFLLVDAVSNGGLIAPVIGMAGFSLALAIPFALFAMFPHWLSSVPKSGSWMNKVKVTLGFIELAFSLKFLSVADMAYGWGILPRGLFVVLWAAMALLLGLYLSGIIRLSSGDSGKRPGIISIVAAIISFGFAVYMITGLWGAPLKAVSAFTPPMSTQRNMSERISVAPDCTDFYQGISMAKSTGRPILLDFTGYGCVNCRKMEASVWTDSEIASLINGEFVLVSLFVDDKTPLEKPVTINENGSDVRIRTYGDMWSLLQRYKFGANAQPFYVIIDSQGEMLAGPYTFDPDIQKFRDFLESVVN